jgi:2'-hydroxyisoflavone reductase
VRILLLGGSSFLGRALAADALARGWPVTTFNRGVTGPDVEGVEALRGDRTDPVALARLRGREWDAAVDTSGFVPRVVGASAALLAERVPAYAFVSSISVYRGWPATAASSESSPLHDCAPDAGPDDGDYGALKAGCERAVQQAYDDGALLVRPGLILGPNENVGRLPAWLDRINRGGRVLAPGDPSVPMQLVDARDVAAFTLDLLAAGQAGPFNVTGPHGNTTYGQWLADCRQVTGSDAELVWVDDDFLLQRGVQPWTELPLWMPMNGESDFAWRADVTKASAAGLRTRPVRETVEDTWAWQRAGGATPARPDRLVHGMDPEKERALLAEWDAVR